MSFFSDLFGGGTPDIDWKEMLKVIDLTNRLNRGTTEGLFTTNSWAENPDGTWTQTQSLNPGMESGFNRLMGRSQGQGFEPYQSPNQFTHLLDAKMANQMDRHGDIPGWGIKMPDEGYGSRSRFREGRFASDYNNPPPKDSEWQENPDRVAWQPPPPPEEAPDRVWRGRDEEEEFEGGGGGRGQQMNYVV